ncbi:(Fe-S)-binding protein [Sphingobium sp. CR2-8]|uniref:(Fe-S)-binding protein n=1 Tax=Sphingobium sp. CR2-8 TaxID=1306534 RepID=UPI002DB95C41|nr:(Fe-S)-binding protein [Sphingobium sp. CR2-8]MEC3909451.1 (Fe-S)-binding protein [Sphingobium sp. CR2-8]
MACNGNGLCFSWDANDAMCPSYKATKDRAQSPKGRAALLRAWGRLAESDDGGEFAQIEEDLAASLSTCLSCKACTSQCPVRVDVPTMGSRFWTRYYKRHRRPFSHHAMRLMEVALRAGRAMPSIANRVGGSLTLRQIVARFLQLEDLPTFSPADQRLRLPLADAGELSKLDASARAKTLVLVEDGFTASFDAAVPFAAAAVLTRLGYKVYRVPARSNGKMLHLLGLNNAFVKLASARASEMAALAQTGVRLVGLDAATALMFEQEYRAVAAQSPRLMLLDEILAQDIEAGHLGAARERSSADPLRVLGHCTEQALRPDALRQWEAIFAHFGIPAAVEQTGCCGMAGMFGHRTNNRAMSHRLFDMSWRQVVERSPEQTVATGFSCRCQIHRMMHTRAPHPAEALLAHLSTITA